jgi:serine/threonine protein kinase
VTTNPDIPGLRITGIIGEGGFATVYHGWQVAVGREVAVKIDNRVLLNERDRRRFVREVNAAGRLSGHSHVVDVYDAGTLGDGRPYIVMEYCGEGSLADALRRNGVMSPARVRDIGIKIADALAAAHSAGVLHRDIKPANILVNRYGVVGLSDFGLASIVAPGGEQSVTREALTPAFASPERFRGQESTVAGDLYSLGATLYALLAGRPPRFPADGRGLSVATIVSLHGEPVEDVPGVPPALMATLRRTLDPDPRRRPRGAQELRNELIAASAPTPAAQTSTITTPHPARATDGLAVRAARHARTPGARTRTAQASGRRRPKARLAAGAGAIVIMVAAAFLIAQMFSASGQAGASSTIRCSALSPGDVAISKTPGTNGSISSPAGNSKVDTVQEVKGSVSGLRPGTYAWVIIVPYDSRACWLEGGALGPASARSFSERAYFGSGAANEGGEPFVVLLVTAPSAVSAGFTNDVAPPEHTLATLPSGVQILATITVKRS